MCETMKVCSAHKETVKFYGQQPHLQVRNVAYTLIIEIER